MANLQKIFSDIDFNFTAQPMTGDVALSYDQQAVIRSIRNLVLTSKYEKPFNSSIGGNIDSLLFEPMNPLTAAAIQTAIQYQIQNFEPRAQLQTVTASPLYDKNSYAVTVSFYLINATQLTTLSLILQRDR